MRRVLTTTLVLSIVASAWASNVRALTSPISASAGAATIRTGPSVQPEGASDLVDGLPAFPQTQLVDAINLRASHAAPQPDYDSQPDRERGSGSGSLAREALATSLYEGLVYDSLSPEPLAGAAIELMRPGHRYGARTNENGYFAIGRVPPGTYLLSLSKSAAYATLHAMVEVRAGRTALRLRLLVLSVDERAWMNQLAYERANVAYPRTAALGTDQYAVLIARELAADVAAGKVSFSDATEETYAARYAALPGAVARVSVSGAIVPGAGNFLVADRLWMAEKANCPYGDWVTCPFGEDTGHYINIASGLGMWMGVGESVRSFSFRGYAGCDAYYVLTVERATSPRNEG